MNIILPGLLWPFIGDIDYLYPQIKMDNLNQLIKKSSVIIHNSRYSDFIYGSILKQILKENKYQATKVGLANRLAEANNLSDKYPHFLVVEPTHLRVDRDRLLICEPELLQLNQDEEQMVIDAINKHFNHEVTIYFLSNNFWLIGINFSLEPEHSYPLIDIIGKNVDDYLPKNTISFSRLLNEMQMLLFSLPLNDIRKSEGSLTVNSVWMWDSIVQPTIMDGFSDHTIFTNNKMLLSSNSKNIGELLSDFNLLTNDSSIFIDSLYYPCCYADSNSFIMLLEAFDKKIGFHLYNKIKSGEINNVRLFIPQQNNTIEIAISNFDKYKLWRNTTFPKIIKDKQ